MLQLLLFLAPLGLDTLGVSVSLGMVQCSPPDWLRNMVIDYGCLMIALELSSYNALTIIRVIAAPLQRVA